MTEDNNWSQEDIDKMLKEAEGNGQVEEKAQEEKEEKEDKMTTSQQELIAEEKRKLSEVRENSKSELSQEHIDILGEMANISFGSASTSLSELLNKPVSINPPTVSVVDGDGIHDLEGPHVILNVNYVKGLEVENLLVIEKRVAQTIAGLMMGGDGSVSEEAELDDMSLSAVQEAMNQMMGASATSMSKVFQRTVDISPPSIEMVDSGSDYKKIKESLSEELLVKISFQLVVEGLIDSKIYQIISLSNARSMADEMLSLANSDNQVNDESQPVSDIKLKDSTGEEVPSYLDGVDVKVEVIFGNTKKRLKDLLVMEKEQIVNLEEDINEPLHIYANGVLIAKGEIVNIDGYFGVQVKELV